MAIDIRRGSQQRWRPRLAFRRRWGPHSPKPVAADGTVLEEIIVTATRREANVQDVPFNMVALGPESLENLRIT